MTKRVRLTEKQMKKAINEISYGKIDNASNISDNIFWDMEVAFQDFYDTVKYNADNNNPYVKKIKEYSDAIMEILLKKSQQRKNFDSELRKFDYNKFYKDDTAPDDYDKMELMDLQKKYPKDISNMRFNGRHMEDK